ncbi:hypothetical protein [Desulfuribacillus alkaliarsenatis]|uniref:DUF4760 domain-containing protein n=1 Tax=Desulfuribacillus alkaliarsenatis TaxID=766136 RepID=A0A1E5G5D7_9FIRM|nr:hypothetical protein [Desulfuribacillus alkaliarsenatis]OEF98373.1 hypothetical protein BHF68_01465 [Desulfuribacillus alkaliarsenatis]
MNMKISRHTVYFIATILVLIAIILLAKIHFDDTISELATILTALFAGVAIFYQLRKDYQLSKAEFIYSLNDTFSNNQEITYIYKKLKEYRDKEGIEFTEDDGRRMGDYVMYFEIMGYLVEEGLITIELADRIFANKFFIFMHNPYVHKYQLKYSEINKPILELYCKWYNYRVKAGLNVLYSNHRSEEFKEYIKTDNKCLVELNESKMNVGYK